MQATGESLLGFQETIGTLLRREDCEVLGADNRLENCVRVKLGPLKYTTGTPHEVNVWFDASADYLPRFYLIASPEMTANFLSGKSGATVKMDEILMTFAVADYQEVRDAGTDFIIKFPWHDGALGRSFFEFVILSVNEPLPPSRLIPQMDRGVEIITHPSTPQQSSQVVGSESDARAHFARSMTASAVQQGAASIQVAQEAPSAIVEPRSLFSRRSIWLGIAVMVTAVFGIVWRVRSR